MKPSPAELDTYLLWASRRLRNGTVSETRISEARIRELAWRALAMRGESPNSDWIRPHTFSAAALRYASDVMRRRTLEDSLANLDWSALCAFERSGSWSSLPRLLHEAELRELEELFGPSAGRLDLARTVLEEVNRKAWELAARVLWRRYGPLFLIVLGTLSAFLFSASIWLEQSGGSPFQVMQEWMRFLSGR